MLKVIFSDTEATCTVSGVTYVLDAEEAMRYSVPPQPRFALPDGTKWFLQGPACDVLVHQTPPSMQQLKWIEAGSMQGAGADYRDVTIALPYVVVMAALGKNGRVLSSNECFFSNTPIKSLDDKLCYPALLNCSKWSAPKSHALSWICTQYLKQSLATDYNNQIRGSIKALFQCLLGTGFNYSSEHNEGNSWFSATAAAKVHPAVTDVDKWQKQSEKDPMFVLEVPWLETNLTVEEIARRVQALNSLGKTVLPATQKLAQFIVNKGRKKE